jgi:restriction system protein
MFFKIIYHFYQYLIKPSKRHRRVIKKAKKTLMKIRLLKNEKQPNYIFGMLRKIDPFVFEELILLCFKERGYTVKRNSRHTGDHGIDGIVFNEGNDKLLLQVKRYSQSINPQHIYEFSRVIQREEARGGFFIHTGRTGNKSKILKAENIRILSGNSLLFFVLGKKIDFSGEQTCHY